MRTKPIDEVIAQQVRFSSRAFGPGPRTEGLLQHIRKELDEIRQDPLDVLEWIDVVILGLDGAWRAASTQHPWLNDADVAKFVADALLYKIGVNMEREWPDWREVGQDQPIEHVRKDIDPGIAASEAKHKASCRDAITQMEWAHQHAQNPRPAPGTVIPTGNRPAAVCDHCKGTGRQRRLHHSEAEMVCAFCRGRGYVEDKRT